MNARRIFYGISIVFLSLISFFTYAVSLHFLWGLILVVPFIIVGISDITQNKQTIKKNYPIIGMLIMFMLLGMKIEM